MATKGETSSSEKSLPKRHSLAAIVLGWILFLHVIGLTLFTRGFLLSRLALDNKAICSPLSSCTLPPTHKRAVIIIIDALRFDFVSPNPPIPSSENYHNILKLPHQLTKSQPQQSFLFNAHSDPPTVTLQRIKGITTGSLPTFVDIGSSFGASSIEEDSIISQLRAAGKAIAFAGDDTWMSVFSKSFAPNMSFPYDSFNVEDLHTVDEGVIRHLFPLLQDKTANWDVLIGHFLGVDHVGHRLGPDHPTMKAKLSQMNDVLRKIVNQLDDETLLVVLGDHGMDRKGDHGGDGDLETSSALWIYSKSKPLSTVSSEIPRSLLTTSLFPSSVVPHRAVQQVDLVPSLSLLLGLPIPFNNLGSIIPELFLRSSKTSWAAHPDILETAARLNAEQVHSYLEVYRASSSGGELDGGWASLQSSFARASGSSKNDAVQNYLAFTRLALSECRSIWAQFNGPLMIAGLIALIGSIPSLVVVYSALASNRDQWERVGHATLILGWGGALFGGLVGLAASVVALRMYPEWTVLSTTNIAVACSAIVSELAMLSFNLVPTIRAFRNVFSRASKASTILPAIILILHSIAFASNSFLIWEDRLVLFFLMTLIAPILISSFSAPSAKLRERILTYTILLAICIRLISISTVCREEQHPFCHVSFYSSSTRPLTPTLMLGLAIPASLLLPNVVRRFLAASKSDKAAAPLFIGVFWRVCLAGGSIYWVFEWIESVYGQDPDGSAQTSASWSISRIVRTAVARVILSLTIFAGNYLWWHLPLNLELKKDEGNQDVAVKGDPPKPLVIVIGYANAYGSMYLLFILPFFALLWLVTQLTGQIVLALSLVAILCFVEVVDSQRDARALSASFEKAGSAQSGIEAVDTAMSGDVSSSDRARSPTFAEPVMLSLLSHLLFFGTGHQAAIPSIQWKTAFVGFPVLTYPFSPALVSLNTFGPFLIPVLALPLLAMWAVSPVQRGRVPVLSDTMRLAVGMLLYFTTLLVGAAGSAAVLRRHLMVWKVFAPRFMLAGIVLLAVDVTLCVGVLIGGARVVAKVRKPFATDV